MQREMLSASAKYIKGLGKLSKFSSYAKVYLAHIAGKVDNNLRQAGMRMSWIFIAVKLIWCPLKLNNTESSFLKTLLLFPLFFTLQCFPFTTKLMESGS